MDLYVDKRDRVWLLDFNVFGPVTDALLFAWQSGQDGSAFRLAGAGGGEEGGEEEVDGGMGEEDAGLLVVEEGEEEAKDSVVSFRVRPSSLSSTSASFLFRVRGAEGTAVAYVAPDPLSMYRAPIDLFALGGQLDMEGLMWATMAQRQQGQREEGSDSDDDDDDDDEEDEGMAQ